MKTQLTIKTLGISWLLICASVCVAQKGKSNVDANATPDISGKWELDTSKGSLESIEKNLPSMKMTMVIEINGPEIHISKNIIVDGRESIGDWFYYTDGRGESNPVVPGSDRELKSSTKWSGKKLVTTTTFDLDVDGHIIQVEGVETLELTKDGMTLVNTVSKRNQKGVDSFNLIYRRAG